MIEKTSAESNSPFVSLVSEQFILLKTFRKRGIAVATPVWFVFDPDNDRKLYVVTAEETGKVKRLRNNPHVLLAPCDRRGNVHGPEIEGIVTFVPDADRPRVNAIMAKRFGFLYWVINVVGSLRRSTRTWFEIVPVA